MTPRKEIKLEDRAGSGTYELIDPLDYKILELLQDEGTMFAGLYPLGDTTKNLTIRFPVPDGAKLPQNLIVTRLRLLHVQELVVKKKAGVSVGGRSIWQRTAEGAAVYKKWLATQKSNKTQKGGVDGIAG